MSRINVLDSSVFNRIAAGEVVDRPASVVKELVENSIDSGADSIDVEIKDGGRSIKVTDNGCGMDFEDLSTAFLPHATSKISKISDLEYIHTLGFRGEALPSIASVAKVTLTSRRKEDETGGRIIIENGKVLEKTPVGAPYGTTVNVTDLFANVPARLKFLRSARSEEGEIMSLMQRIILANHNTAISLTVSGKEVYRSEGKGLEEAAYSVYGKDFLKEYDRISCDAPGIEIYGYINKPAFSRHNRSYQTLIVNGRYVVNQELSFWVYNCCSDFLMKRQYPAYVLFINVPADMVDINVHPSKMEVKFIDIGSIKRLLSHSIAQLYSKAAAKPKTIERITEPVDNQTIFFGKDESGAGDIVVQSEMPLNAVPCDGRNEGDITNETADKKPATPLTKSSVTFPDRSAQPRAADRSYSERNFGALSQNSSYATLSEDANPSFRSSLLKDIIADKSGSAAEGYEDISNHEYCGKLFNTYLMVENDKEVILIDQHAAHERLLYDELVREAEQGKNTVQDLLFPYIFDVDWTEAELIDEHLSEINEAGFGVGKLSGNSYSLSSVPLVLSDMDLSVFVTDLIALLKKGKFGKLPFRKNALMQSACKAAIKGSMNITDDDARLLINDICQKHIALFCPHGRPIAVKIKKTEIEKWFKRII